VQCMMVPVCENLQGCPINRTTYMQGRQQHRVAASWAISTHPMHHLTACVQVKPQYLDGILEALRPHLLPSHLVISIAAGVKVASLEASLPEGTRLVRAP
jgi:pyrroline-5-carboxylate reductase